MKTKKDEIIKLSLVILSSLLCTLALPPYSIESLAWIGLVPLIYVLAQERVARKGFAYGLGFGIVFQLISTSWSLNVSYLGWILSTWMAIFPAIFGALVASNHKTLGALTPIWWASTWIALEGIRTYLIPFGWNPTASMTSELSLLQNAAWGGQWIVGFAIVLTNATIAFLINKKGQETYLNSILLWLIILSPLWLVGYQRLNTPIGKKDVTINILTNKHTYTDALEKRWDTLQDNIKITIAHNDPHLTIWPESIGFVLLGHQAVWDEIKTMCQETSGPILLTPSYPLGEYIYNSSILLSNKGEEAQIYKKRYLTPLGEYIPRILPEGLRLGKRTPGDNSKNSTLLVRNSGNDKPYRIGMLICVEETLPKAAHRRVKDGAELLVSPSTHGDTGYNCAKQQEKMGQLRAIETGKTLVRSGNMGGSSIYDGLGNKIWSQEMPSIEKVTIPILNLKPPSEKSQDVTYWAITLIAIVGLLKAPLTNKINKTNIKGEEFWT